MRRKQRKCDICGMEVAQAATGRPATLCPPSTGLACRRVAARLQEVDQLVRRTLDEVPTVAHARARVRLSTWLARMAAEARAHGSEE